MRYLKVVVLFCSMKAISAVKFLLTVSLFVIYSFEYVVFAFSFNSNRFLISFLIPVLVCLHSLVINMVAFIKFFFLHLLLFKILLGIVVMGWYWWSFRDVEYLSRHLWPLVFLEKLNVIFKGSVCSGFFFYFPLYILIFFCTFSPFPA